MFLLTLIRKLYKALSSDSSPSAIAFAAGFGIIAGSVPVLSGVFVFMLLLVLVFRVQIATAILTWGIMKGISAAGLARAFEAAGESLLENDALRGFWTWFLNLRIVAWFGLENYAILGGAAIGLLIAILIFFPVRMLVVSYRRFAHERLSQNRFFRWLTSFWLTKALRLILVGAQP